MFVLRSSRINLNDRKYYRPQTKLWDGNVFTGVCHSVQKGSPTVPWKGRPLPPPNIVSRPPIPYHSRPTPPPSKPSGLGWDHNWQRQPITDPYRPPSQEADPPDTVKVCKVLILTKLFSLYVTTQCSVYRSSHVYLLCTFTRHSTMGEEYVSHTHSMCVVLDSTWWMYTCSLTM